MKYTNGAMVNFYKKPKDTMRRFNTDSAGTGYVPVINNNNEGEVLFLAEDQKRYSGHNERESEGLNEKECNGLTLYQYRPVIGELTLSEPPETYMRKLITNNKEMKKVIAKIKQVAATDFTVIIQGETGTGKTMIARILHSLSRRSPKPFVHVDINAIPESLIETELFGHEKGSFTGAYRKKQGFFEAAHEGTIFIDDLQNMSYWIQGKILSVIEEKKLYCVGSSVAVHINVRIIAATNNDIRKSLKEKRIREDLFYRLGEFFVNIPALRERADDIPLLFRAFVDSACAELGRPKLKYSDSIIKTLTKHMWPGNVRELKYVARRAVLFCDSDTIEDKHIEIISPHEAGIMESDLTLPLKEITGRMVREVETVAIRNALVKTGGNKKKASALLQVDYKTLINKIKEYEIEKK
ncbi:MAG: sigma-54-dependent Fis family transcriptional regulator [Nitrospirae bacterium]|nr:sigma-54-dependent Fis family transcriptional regulator [Nitrospirota bacterium]